MDTKNDNNTEKRHGRHRPGDYMIPASELYLRVSGYQLPTEPRSRRAQRND